MKDLRPILLITLLVAGIVTNLQAQRKQGKTSSARAVYGVSEPVSHKPKKKQKTNKAKQTRAPRQSKTSREKSPAYRKRNNWAG